VEQEGRARRMASNALNGVVGGESPGIHQLGDSHAHGDKDDVNASANGSQNDVTAINY
jgi:hypothetical protein